MPRNQRASLRCSDLNVSRRQKRASSSAADINELTVISNWSGSVLVSDRELSVIELYLADALDQLINVTGQAGKAAKKARGPP
jgi:hypothetical protein